MPVEMKVSVETKDSEKLEKPPKLDTSTSKSGSTTPEAVPATPSPRAVSPKSPRPGSTPTASRQASGLEAPVTYKTNISERINTAIAQAKLGKNRSPELVPLSQEFETMRKKLRTLIAAAKKYNESYVAFETSRAEMVASLAALSEGSPLYDQVGKASDAESLAWVNVASAKEAKRRAIEYHKNIVDYCVEWEYIVSNRVDNEMKLVTKLRQDRSHYETKVDKLRADVNKQESSGKSPSKTQTDKVSRNEMKLKESFEAHETAAAKMCNLLQEVTRMGWKDLYPLVVKSLEWEMDRVSGENDTFGSTLPSVMAKLNTAHEVNGGGAGQNEEVEVDENEDENVEDENVKVEI